MTAKHAVVIGAGAAGLVTAREFLRVGFAVTVFEQSAQVGGLWVYSDATEVDPLGQTGTRQHSSLYSSLRTNLPRDLMAFRDYPFDDSLLDPDGVVRRFPHHSTVLAYLNRFCRDYDLSRHIRFGHSVRKVTRADGQWRVEVSAAGGATLAVAADTVVVCNGHFAEPRLVPIAGLDPFDGPVLHSHNYRAAQPFAGMRVGLIGGSASAVDIGNDLLRVASAVTMFATSFGEGGPAPTSGEEGTPVATEAADDGLGRAPMLASMRGNVPVCVDGTEHEPLDAIMYCTGYHYRFDFLDAAVVDVDDNAVGPLYQEILAVREPSLGFVGIPFRVLPFPLCEIQARWFAAVCAGAIALPAPATMFAEEQARRSALAANGEQNRHRHRMGFPAMFEYCAALAKECKAPAFPPAAMALLQQVGGNRMRSPHGYRDLPVPPLY